jgi:hypothetical protein
MTETPAPTTSQTIDESTDYKKLGVLGLRFIQLISISLFVVGFIWGGSDFLSSLLPKDGPVTPLSVLLMLYGIMGSVVIEVAIRIVQRKK